MFQSLYSRLALVLLSVFLAMAVLLFFLFEQASIATQNEASQRLHKDLARNIVKDLGITSHGKYDPEMIKEAFHQMMILGPTIELYVLDEHGKLVTYDAPEDKIKRRSVDLSPIEKFISEKADLPILGDDPRSLSKQKIFSAAKVMTTSEDARKFVGYLYIIIGGEKYDSVASALQLGNVWKITVFGIASAILFLLFVSLLLFYALTRPLRSLTKEIKAFEQEENLLDLDDESKLLTEEKTALPEEHDKGNGKGNDELSQLEHTFHQMEERIAAQLDRLNKQDNIRREFLAYVSHDLRTPLAGMKAYLETLESKQDTMPREEQHTFLKKAISNGDRLEGMINELFELTRLESHQVELNTDEFPIGDLLSDIYSSLEKKASDNHVKLKIICDEPQAHVVADIAKIERVLQNLAENAIRYSQDGGDVIISANKLVNGVQIKISDSGPGISPDNLPFIFEPYYRVSDEHKLKHKGAGLGLAISQRLLALHGIKISVDSKPGKGTSFSFTLRGA